MERKNTDHKACEKFLGLVQLLLDNETDKSQETYISEHIDECSPCFQHLEIEKQFRDIIRKKIEKKEVPAELVKTIETKIKALVSPA